MADWKTQLERFVEGELTEVDILRLRRDEPLPGPAVHELDDTLAFVKALGRAIRAEMAELEAPLPEELNFRTGDVPDGDALTSEAQTQMLLDDYLEGDSRLEDASLEDVIAIHAAITDEMSSVESKEAPGTLELLARFREQARGRRVKGSEDDWHLRAASREDPSGQEDSAP